MMHHCFTDQIGNSQVLVLTIPRGDRSLDHVSQTCQAIFSAKRNIWRSNPLVYQEVNAHTFRNGQETMGSLSLFHPGFDEPDYLLNIQ